MAALFFQSGAAGGKRGVVAAFDLHKRFAFRFECLKFLVCGRRLPCKLLRFVERRLRRSIGRGEHLFAFYDVFCGIGCGV